MKAGYVRVALTTNFDRLLEQALSSTGLEPSVISTADAAHGAIPLTHSRCVVIKVNGDYLDPRLRNTPTELAEYEEPMVRLLDRIFDEFGLVICGWSGDWDLALRGAIERCPARRFPAYWATKGKLGDQANRLAQFRGATVVQTDGADEFFTGLSDKVVALEGYEQQDTVSKKVAMTRVKRYLSSDEHRIRLHDLLHAQTEAAVHEVHGNRFPLQSAPFNPSELFARLRRYEAVTELLRDFVACSTYWGQPQHDDVILKSFRRVAADFGSQGGLVVWLTLRRYPALLLLYGTGLSAIASGNYRLLARLLTCQVRPERHKPSEPAAVVLHNLAVLDRGGQKQLPGREREFTPLSNHLFELFREPMREYLADDSEYENAFDWLEYLIALVHADLTSSWPALQQAEQEGKEPTAWGPIGCFGWRNRYGDREIVAEPELNKGEQLPGKVAAVLQAGLFGGGGATYYDRFRGVKRAFDRRLGTVRMQWH
jgi:hypothetical protein